MKRFLDAVVVHDLLCKIRLIRPSTCGSPGVRLRSNVLSESLSRISQVDQGSSRHRAQRLEEIP